MAAKRIPHQKKYDTRCNGGQPKPERKRQHTVVVQVCKGTTVLTSPDRAEKVKEKYQYLNEF